MIVWPSNGFIAMIDEPKPNALRRVTWSFGTVRRCCTANMRAAVAQDPLSLGERARQHPGIVGQEDTGKPEGPDDVEEVRGLVGGGAVDGPRHHTRVVGHDGHTLAAEAGQGGHDGSPEGRLDLEKRPLVDQRRRARARSGTAAGIWWNEVKDVVQPARAGVGSWPYGGGDSHALSGK